MDDSTPGDGGAVVYLVPYRWWKEAQEGDRRATADVIPYAMAPAPSSSTAADFDLVFELRRGDPSRGAAGDEGVSCRCHALIRSDLWSMAIRWHSEASLKKESSGTSYLSEDVADDVYPVMLRISAVQETNVMTVKICKKDNVNENYSRACKLFAVDSEVVYIWDFSGQINLIIRNEGNRMFQDGLHQSENVLQSAKFLEGGTTMKMITDGCLKLYN